MVEGFNLNELETAARGTPGEIRVQFGVHETLPLSGGDLEGLLTRVVGTTNGGRKSPTVADVFDATNAYARFREIEAELQRKGNPVSRDGYTVAVFDEDGEQVLDTVDVEEALTFECQTGYLISVNGKIRGA